MWKNAIKGFTGALLCLFIFSTTWGAEPEGTTLPPKEKFHLFILAGQSNMAGRGAVSEEDRTPHPRVLMLNKARKWVPAVDPLHFDKTIAGTGLGKTFGMLVAEADPEITIGLIPCAVGGTPLAKWEPGVFDQVTKCKPWDDCMARVAVALPAGTLKGILWHQGEGDCTPEKSAVYEEKLTELIQRFRNDLQAPQVPFIAGQLGQFPDKPWNDSKIAVDTALHQTAKKVPHMAVVSSAGLVDKGDGIHFDAPSLREFGKRYAEAYFNMSAQK